MKYIRTKDGIYELDCSLEIRDNFLIKKGYYYCIDDYCEDESLGEIIAQADTIEELCDEFVIENDYCGQISQSRYFDFEVAKQNIDIASNDVIYGALRIAGKGLIYVAKMNENGELVLI